MLTGIWETRAGRQRQHFETALKRKRAESAVSQKKKREQDKTQGNKSKVSETVVPKVSRQMGNAAILKHIRVCVQCTAVTVRNTAHYCHNYPEIPW